MVNIAVLGYGTVGSGVVEVINTNHKSINKRAGAEINVKYVLDLRDFPGDPVEKVLVHDYEIIANDPEVDIVVEVMGGTGAAYNFTKRALEAGKSVCTSNKALVAKYGPELMEIAKEKEITLRWVCQNHVVCPQQLCPAFSGPFARVFTRVLLSDARSHFWYISDGMPSLTSAICSCPPLFTLRLAMRLKSRGMLCLRIRPAPSWPQPPA